MGFNAQAVSDIASAMTRRASRSRSKVLFAGLRVGNQRNLRQIRIIMGRLDDLNQSQVQCLEFVARGITTSKAIAAQTGLSPSSVDNYLQRSAKLLGVGNRIEAAARYIELKDHPHPSVSQSVSRSAQLARLSWTSLHGVVAGVRWLFDVPPVGGRKHNLNRIETSISILKIAGLSVIFLCSIALVLSGVLWALG